MQKVQGESTLKTLIRHDTVKAFEYYHQGAEAGNMTAMYFVYEGYRDGKGVAADQEKAQHVLDECAEKGGSLYSKLKRVLGNLNKNK